MYILIIVNLIITLLILFMLNNYNTQKSVNNELSDDKLMFMSHIYTSVSNDNLYIKNQKLNNYIKNKNYENENILVIRYSRYSCKSCIDFVLNYLSKYIPNFKENPKILFIISDCNENSPKEFINTIILNKGELLNMPAEELRIPLLFVINNNIIKHVYMPDTSQKDIMGIYFKELLNRYKF